MTALPIDFSRCNCALTLFGVLLPLYPMGCCSARQVAADAPASEIAESLKRSTKGLKAGVTASEMSFTHTGAQGPAYESRGVSGGYFGDFGGRYIPETLVEALGSVTRRGANMYKHPLLAW